MPNFSFGHVEMKKVAKGLLITVVSAVLAYLISDVIPLFKGTSLVVLIPLMNVIVNSVKEFLVNNTKQ